MAACSTGRTRRTSSVTAANTSAGRTPRAPSLAPPRRARRAPAGGGGLAGEPAQLRARFGVRDRRGDELGEGDDPRLGVVREQLVALGRDHDHAPEAPVDDDRGTDRGAQAPLPAKRRSGAGRVLIVAHPRGPPGPQDRPSDALAFSEVDACADRYLISGGTPAGDSDRRPVG